MTDDRHLFGETEPPPIYPASADHRPERAAAKSDLAPASAAARPILGLSAGQIARRRGYVCGSDAGKIMAGEWRDLWRIKTGVAQEEDLSDVLAVQMGSFTEPLNSMWFTKQTGREVVARNAWIVSHTYPWMAANLDGETVTSKGAPAYIDFKHVGRLDEQTVLRYTPQGVHCATILGRDWWILSVFVGNSRWELIEQPVDPFYQAELIAKERQFWGYIERGEEPPEMTVTLAPKPQPKLRTILLDELTPGGTDWPNWGADLIAQFRIFADTKPAADRHGICRKDIAAVVPEDVGLVSYGLCSAKRDGRGFTISLKKVGRDE